MRSARSICACPGLHNVYNSLAAIAVGFELDVRLRADRRGTWVVLPAREGVFNIKGEVGGVLVIDDYGHHPTEIKATLAAAKIGSGGRRIVVLFQPHRYSRTHDLMEEFARSFNNADSLFITDIYAASEEPIEGVTAEALTEAIKRFGHKDAQLHRSAGECADNFARSRSAWRSRAYAGSGHCKPRERSALGSASRTK